MTSISKPIKLSEIDIDNYSFKVSDLQQNKIVNLLFKKQLSKNNKKQFNRLIEIVKIIHSYKLTKENLTPIKLKNLLEELGPTFVKIGQILSKRTELLPKNYCKELESLCVESKPLDYTIIKEVIENELGDSIDNIFSSFDQTSIGSASIAQAHKAVLKNGQSVVIKVQRPNIKNLMEQDILLLNSVLKITKLINIFDNIDLISLVNDIWKTTQQELNFFVEAINTIKFKQFSNKYNNIDCPTIYEEYTTQKVLTMEYIDANTIDNLPNTIDKKELGNAIAQNYINQVLTNNFFHADPHQGNLFIKVNNDQYTVVWIDFGLVYYISNQEQLALKKMITAITKRDIEMMMQSILTLTTIVKNGQVNYSKLYTDIDYLLDKYSTINLKDIQINIMLNDILSTIRANNLQVTSMLSMLTRGLITIEGVITSLTNELNLMEILRQYVIKDSLTFETLQQLSNELTQTTLTSIKKGLEIPALSNSLLQMMLKGQTKINLQLEDSYNYINEFKKSSNNLYLTLIICALIIGASIVYIVQVEPMIGNIPIISIIGYVIAIILSIILFIKQVIRKYK